MSTRRDVLGGLGAAGSIAAGAPVFAQELPWTIPPDERIHELLVDRIDRQRRGVGIVVGVIEGGARRVTAYGASGTGRPLDGDTVFQIGSVSKMFATLLLADAAARGEVRLDDRASTYLPPGVSMPASKRPMTLEHLATHMSGLPSMPTNLRLEASPNPIEAYTPDDLHRFLPAYQLPYEPGEGFAYSNLGVALLGRMLAARAGVTYETLLRRRVLSPLALRSTSITLDRDQRARLAVGHDMYGQPVDTWEMRTLQASGSLRSTANDLLSFMAAYFTPRSTPLAQAIEVQVNQPSPARSSRRQSLGVPIYVNAGGQSVLFHDGGKEGYRSFLAFNPTARTGVVVLANSRSDDSLEGLVLHLMGGRPLPERPPTPRPVVRRQARLPRRLMERCEGRYRLPSGDVLAVACRRDRMLLDELGEGVSVFYPEAPDRFFSRVDPSQVVFQAEGAAAARRLILFRGGRALTAERLIV